MQAVAAARELAAEQKIAAVEGDLAALRTHREMLTAQLARESRGHSWSPELKGLFVGAALAVTTLTVFLLGIGLLAHLHASGS